MLRSVPARWFELLVARDHLVGALEALAHTAAVEPEMHGETEGRIAVLDLESQLREYRELARRYQPYWPASGHVPGSPTPSRPASALAGAMALLRAWRDEADPVIRELEALRAGAAELQHIDDFLAHLPAGTLDVSRLARAEAPLAVRLYVLPPGTRVTQVPAATLTRTLVCEGHDYLLAVGAAAEMPLLDRDLAAAKGRPITLPPWLRGERAEARSQVGERLAAMAGDGERRVAALDAIAVRHGLAGALAGITRLEWFLDHAHKLPVSDSLGWITGWTSDRQGRHLREALRRAKIPGLVRVRDAAPGQQVPTVYHNPWWARPFEVFSGLLGTPGRDEANPSRLLAVLVPLMFGYMFGDVGQGAVLVVVGALLLRRWPVTALLVPCGLSAMAFGVAFGSVFGREDVLPALWLHPLEHPLPVLAAPLAGGVAIIVLGQALNGLEALWRGALAVWLRVECALLAWYLSPLLLFWRADAAAAAAGAALAWYLAGSLWERRAGRGPVTVRLAHLLETTLQLAVNTVSFARVGAFALAHAGVSLAIVTLADASDSSVVRAALLAAGNLVVLVLEGLVVSIQTTRLVLFEFFVRFLRGEGRGFRPITPPLALRISNLGTPQ